MDRLKILLVFVAATVIQSGKRRQKKYYINNAIFATFRDISNHP